MEDRRWGHAADAANSQFKFKIKLKSEESRIEG